MDNLFNLSEKVKMAFLSLLDDFYSIEKSHTTIVMPFFGFLHTSGNESKPILNYVDINILDIMKSHFKDVYVYAGENRFLEYYGLRTDVVSHLANEQNILSRIVNRTTNFSGISDNHNEILSLYQETLENFEKAKIDYPLPYKAMFHISSPYDLIDFVKTLDKKQKEKDKLSKICVICPSSYISDNSKEVYDLLKMVVGEINALLYFSQNQSDLRLYSSIYRFINDEQIKEKVIQSVQDFANQYCDDVSKVAYKCLDAGKIYQRIINGEFGNIENEIIDKLNKVDVMQIYKDSFIDSSKQKI